MNARKMILLGAVLSALSVGAAVSGASTPKPAPNAGLPKQWFGVTTWEYQGAVRPTNTYAQVTLTLTGKTPYKRSSFPASVRGWYFGATGTMYHFSVTGKITANGYCSTGTTIGQLEPKDGELTVEVAKAKGKLQPAAYYGQDNQWLWHDLPSTCPDGNSPTGTVAYWGFRTTGLQPKLRPLSTSARFIKGAFVDPTNPANHYEWCLVRSRKDLILCGYLVTPS